MIFGLSSNTPEQRVIVEAAIEKCDFPFERMLPKLKETKNKELIPVTWDDLTRFASSKDANPVQAPSHRAHDNDHGGPDARQATLGLAYYSGRISIEQSLINNPALAEEVFLAEAAHMVDFFYLTQEQRDKLYDLFHKPGYEEHDHGWFEETGNFDYHSWVGEAWMYGFIHAFTDLTPDIGDMQHSFDPDDIPKVRALLEVDTEKGPDPFFASKWSYAYHNSKHWWVCVHRTFPTRLAAIEAGLRPCKVCKP